MSPFSMSVSFGSQATNPSGPVISRRLRSCVGKFARCRLKPRVEVRLKLAGLLFRPRFVKIWITPPDASEPYSVAAAGPLSTSTRSISSGFRSESRSSPAPPEKAQQVVEPPVPLPHSPPRESTRTPSM